jgi:outer membrane protein
MRGILLAAVAAIALTPAASGAMTLSEALAAAYNNNPTLLAQRAALRATD